MKRQLTIQNCKCKKTLPYSFVGTFSNAMLAPLIPRDLAGVAPFLRAI